MPQREYYLKGNSERGYVSNSKAPLISKNLDSVRTYQWEIHFDGVPLAVNGPVPKFKPLTLAAKSVSQIGYQVEDIEVHRVNDKVFYPGKASPDELTVVFDNLYQPQIAQRLYQWFQTVYNPVTGVQGVTSSSESPRDTYYKDNATVLLLDGAGNAVGGTKLYGLYPKSWKLAELKYASTNEFHTVEMKFRYDVAIQYDRPALLANT
jgi:hypothetical protein